MRSRAATVPPAAPAQRQSAGVLATPTSERPVGGAGTQSATASGRPRRQRARLRVRSLDGEPSTELLFERLFGDAEHAFWLDSADAPTRLAQRSYLGTSAGPDRCVLQYDVGEGMVTTHRADASKIERGSIFHILDRELYNRAIEPPVGSTHGLLGGFVGYLGYECKADCGSSNAHRSDLPDATLMLANRVVAVDHLHHRTSCSRSVATTKAMGARKPSAGSPTPRRSCARSWPSAPESTARAVPKRGRGGRRSEDPPAAGETPIAFRCGRGREQYLADIARCQTALGAGESYEICLTDQISTSASPRPFDLYRVLRRVNPAPFAAYLKIGELAVLSSSPERFLSIDRDRRVQARPIKGTTSRSEDPTLDEALRTELVQDEKTYAEHLMIVDLLRNDLGRVCEIDSVRVPELMVVEPYTTVHQLISTVTGVLEERAPRWSACARASPAAR